MKLNNKWLFSEDTCNDIYDLLIFFEFRLPMVDELINDGLWCITNVGTIDELKEHDSILSYLMSIGAKSHIIGCNKYVSVSTIYLTNDTYIISMYINNSNYLLFGRKSLEFIEANLSNG